MLRGLHLDNNAYLKFIHDFVCWETETGGLFITMKHLSMTDANNFNGGYQQVENNVQGNKRRKHRKAALLFVEAFFFLSTWLGKEGQTILSSLCPFLSNANIVKFSAVQNICLILCGKWQVCDTRKSLRRLFVDCWARWWFKLGFAQLLIDLGTILKPRTGSLLSAQKIPEYSG